MNPVFIAIVSLLVVAQLALPKRWGFLPLIIAGCHLGNIEVLPELTPARLLIIVGLARAVSGKYFIWSTKSRLDVFFLLFSALSILSTVGHKADEWIPSPFNARAGLVINVFGCYLYGRAYLSDIGTFRRYAFLLPLILIPLAICLTLEKSTRKNLYHILGAAKAESAVREDKVRAQGPFSHPILAGCAGATALPFAYLAWRLGRRKTAIFGGAACMGVTLASSSSGPLAAVAVTLASIAFWNHRHHLRKVLWGMVAFALLYWLIKGRGPWYLMASIDLVGGSTGWHRAKLMDQGFVYLNEWWLFGSDYTRHWMSSGVRWNPNMVDLTNYYLHLGVTGGLPLTLCLVAFLVTSYKLLTRTMDQLRAEGDPDEIVLWCAGASLLTHAVSFVSISYFDQMYVFFYLLLGAIPGLCTSAGTETTTKESADFTDLAEPIHELRS